MKKQILIFFIFISATCFLTSCTDSVPIIESPITSQLDNNSIIVSPSLNEENVIGTPQTVIAGDFNKKFVRTHFYYNDESVMILKSVNELNTYKDSIKQRLQDHYYLEENVDMPFSDYNDSYFEENILYVALIVEGSGSVRHNVLDIECDNNTMTVTIERLVPECGTCDMAQWHLFVEVPKDCFNGNEGKLEVIRGL